MILAASSKSVSVGCSKHGYIELDSMPAGLIRHTNSAGRCRAPGIVLSVGHWVLGGKQITPTVGADVPEMMNWCAGKLGPWLVWNMRSAKVYCSAIWK